GPLPGGTARADRGENERAAGEAEEDFQTAAGGRPDGSAEAQLGSGNWRSRKTKTQGGRRSSASQPVAAGIWKKDAREIDARSRNNRAAPKESLIRPVGIVEIELQHVKSAASAFIAVDIPDGEGRREVNNDTDCVSGRGGEPDPAMAGTERTS